MIGRRLLLSAIAAAALVVASPRDASCQASPGAEAFVAKVADAALTVMTSKGVPDGERIKRFREIFVGATDMPEIGRFVLGRHWNAAVKEGKDAQFLKLFEEVVVLTWSTRFKDYAATVNHKVIGSDPDGDKGVLVRSVVAREAQAPVNLTWRVRQGDGEFKAVDLMVEGTAMAITYRSEYASVMQASGGKIDGLLAALQRKIQQLNENPAR